MYPHDLYPKFHDDVKIIKGNERACVEGCVGNSLGNLQIMYLDHQGKGGWTLVVGKGFDEETVDGLSGRVFLAGPCAVEEIGEKLVERLGESNVYQSKECNDLTAIVEAMCHLMKVDVSKMNPYLEPERIRILFDEVFRNKCHARITNASCGVRKLR